MVGQWANGWYTKTLSRSEVEGNYVEITGDDYAALFANHLEGYEKERLHGNTKAVEVWLKEHGGFVYYVMDLVKSGGEMMLVSSPERGASFITAKGLSRGATVGFTWDAQGFLIFYVGHSFI